MLTWLALAHMLCWEFGMWKVKPQMPPALTVIFLHAPLSKPESHILQHSQTRKTQQLTRQPRSDPLLQDTFCEQQALFTPWVCSTRKVPPVGCGWGIGSRRKMGTTARESPFSTDPKAIHYQLQQRGLALPPWSALFCSHTLGRQSRFSACFPQENPWDFVLGQVSALLSLPQGCVKS